jgi:hypothetical protein
MVKDNELLGCTFQPKLMQSSIGTADDATLSSNVFEGTFSNTENPAASSKPVI